MQNTKWTTFWIPPLAETQYVHLWRKTRAQLCGWVSLVKAKISLNPTPNILKQNMPSQMLSYVRQFLHKTLLLVLIIKETLKCFIIWSWWFWQMFLSVQGIGELAKLIGNDYWREKVWQTSDILDHISTCLLTYSLIRFDER